MKLLILKIVIVLCASLPCWAQWQPARGPLMTRWAKDVSPQNALPEYPRPQLVRQDWLNLNGLWSYALRPRSTSAPTTSDGEILVPFPIESALSGVMKRVGDDQTLWYSRSFELPAAWRGQRILLHFGAVDWAASIRVNGTEVGTHRGGYDPFTIDISSALKTSGTQELVVAVDDPTDGGTQPRGKQVRNPEGIWYTPTTGIWQTVWLEPVPRTAIARLKQTPDADTGLLRIAATIDGATAGVTIKAVARDGDRSVAEVSGPASGELVLQVPDVKLWWPETPFLYDLRVTLEKDGQVLDSVESYFGLRKIAVGKDSRGVTRILLNNKFVFQFGPLDQGFWPDGLYTAPTDAALRYDIEITRELGFNMARKHVKVEPARWYYWCDKLGLLVWQDMPSGDGYIGPGQPDFARTPESAKQFETELQRMIDSLWNHPSIVMWVPFNEGWGQYDTERVTAWVKSHDPSRLVNNASGWVDRNVGDVHDVHIYPGPGSPPPTDQRAAVLGEFGGLGLPVSGHTWQDEKNWGYRSFKTKAELTAAYVALMKHLHPLIGSPGLSAAVYTQTTDVEIEVNGLLTYDRANIKLDAKLITAANRKLYLTPPVIRPLVPTSESTGLEWHYTTTRPAEGWEKPEFDDSSWKKGPAGFGTQGTPGAVVRTEWNSQGIWLRREIELPADVKVADPHFSMHHDEDVDVYLNGVLAAQASGYTSGYAPTELTSAGLAVLKPGKLLIAVHCRQTRGGQYIDLGIVDRIEVAR